ncbi:Crp/Fnr family transcriptional regulator [Bradyrhizobium sp. 83012]|uniref:Crp/Fnr family transcriptional regulator n=1 Tax=Bradyrhizobium aeschynomenes TaxID=2734909 RepID=A0ABX2CPF0_9BRAD|nr:Crp/Fnr family transcriptional regulator [Bradyrhizobium aeschynomenes]NPU70028.1 Crp/Fnr family transcriptional regulator [Bradyrhizobium aeschynomenes]
MGAVPSSNLAKFDPTAFLDKICSGRKLLKIPRGHCVFAQGNPANTLFFLQQGKIKLTVVNDAGKEAVVGIVDAGQFFGEGCLTRQPLHTGSACALQDCVVIAIARKAMIAALRLYPELAEMFISFLLGRIGRFEADLIDQLFHSSEQRLARLLLTMANYGRDGTPLPIIPKVSQETMAEMIGTTRSRVSHFMNKFRKAGLIAYDGEIVVYPALLQAVLNDNLQAEQHV